MITTRKLTVTFGKKQIVKSVCFQARPGELTAVIGPNGSGKTSLLRALSGEIPYQGSAVLNEREVADTSVWNLALQRAVLPQFSNVTFPFTVREVVSLGAVTRNQDIYDLPEQALQKVGLISFSGRKYHELSGGEQQRVQFARVLCQVWQSAVEESPRWLFLDEPISSLDIQHQLSTMKIAKEFARNGGGVIAILHDLNLAAMFADHILLISNGEILGAGTSEQVLKDDLLNEAFGCNLKVGKLPPKDQQFVLPQSAYIQ